MTWTETSKFLANRPAFRGFTNMLTTLPLLLMTGCSSEQVEVYLFFLGQQETLSDSTSVGHNFSGAYEPEDEDDWTRSDDSQVSSQALFGELVTLVDGTALLQVAGQTYPGSGDQGVWTFGWEDFERGQTADTHTAGYTYTTEYESSRVDTISLSEGTEPGTLSGSWETETTVSLDEAETDTWGLDVGITTGQIDGTGLLVVEDQFGNVTTAANTYQETDCDGSPCLLSTKTSTEMSRTLQAILTDYTPEDLEQDLDDFGQNEGL